MSWYDIGDYANPARAVPAGIIGPLIMTHPLTKYTPAYQSACKRIEQLIEHRENQYSEIEKKGSTAGRDIRLQEIERELAFHKADFIGKYGKLPKNIQD